MYVVVGGIEAMSRHQPFRRKVSHTRMSELIPPTLSFGEWLRRYEEVMGTPFHIRGMPRSRSKVIYSRGMIEDDNKEEI